MNIKKLLFYSFFIFLLFFIFIIFINYYYIKKACSRLSTLDYEIKIKEGYENLIKNKNLEYINIFAEDRTSLSGYLISRPNAKAVILICHGYRQSKEFMYRLVNLFNDFTIFLLDFRCHGQSEDKTISFGFFESLDVKAACGYLKSNLKTKDLPIFGLGFSMGCSALLKAAQESSCFKGLILDSCFSRLDIQLSRRYKRVIGLPKFMMSFSKLIFEFIVGVNINQINPINFINNLNIPIFMIHSKNDKVVPFKYAKKLYQVATCTKDLWIVNDSRHVNVYNDYSKEYKQKVTDFILKFVNV